MNGLALKILLAAKKSYEGDNEYKNETFEDALEQIAMSYTFDNSEGDVFKDNIESKTDYEIEVFIKELEQ